MPTATKFTIYLVANENFLGKHEFNDSEVNRCCNGGKWLKNPLTDYFGPQITENSQRWKKTL